MLDMSWSRAPPHVQSSLRWPALNAGHQRFLLVHCLEGPISVVGLITPDVEHPRHGPIARIPDHQDDPNSEIPSNLQHLIAEDGVIVNHVGRRNLFPQVRIAVEVTCCSVPRQGAE